MNWLKALLVVSLLSVFVLSLILDAIDDILLGNRGGWEPSLELFGIIATLIGAVFGSEIVTRARNGRKK